MCEDPSLLVHECTNGVIPNSLHPSLRLQDLGDEGGSESRRLREELKKGEVRKKAMSRGHSTPDEVGHFAKTIRARRVVLNHFSTMYVYSLFT